MYSPDTWRMNREAEAGLKSEMDWAEVQGVSRWMDVCGSQERTVMIMCLHEYFLFSARTRTRMCVCVFSGKADISILGQPFHLVKRRNQCQIVKSRYTRGAEVRASSREEKRRDKKRRCVFLLTLHSRIKLL